MPEKANPLMNEVEEFLKDTESDPTKVDVLDASLIPEDPVKGNEGTGADTNDDEGNGELKPRNRRERRLMDKLAAERESSSFMAGKLAARTEAERFISEESDYLKGVERIYGTDSPEAQIATDLLKKALVGMANDAEERAYQRIMSERDRETQEFTAAQTELDNIVDEIEDEYGVTLTAPQEKAFFTLLERMSPKDRDGNVREYADPHAVYEVFQEKLAKRPSPETNRAKDLSSRSMVNSGTSKESNLDNDVTARFLKEQGII